MTFIPEQEENGTLASIASIQVHVHMCKETFIPEQGDICTCRACMYVHVHVTVIEWDCNVLYSTNVTQTMAIPGEYIKSHN